MAFDCLPQFFLLFFFFSTELRKRKRIWVSVYFAARRFLSSLMINLSTMYHYEVLKTKKLISFLSTLLKVLEDVHFRCWESTASGHVLCPSYVEIKTSPMSEKLLDGKIISRSQSFFLRRQIFSRRWQSENPQKGFGIASKTLNGIYGIFIILQRHNVSDAELGISVAFSTDETIISAQKRKHKNSNSEKRNS